MKVNEETNHTHASLDSKDYGYCAREEPTITRSFTKNLNFGRSQNYKTCYKTKLPTSSRDSPE